MGETHNMLRKGTKNHPILAVSPDFPYYLHSLQKNKKFCSEKFSVPLSGAISNFDPRTAEKFSIKLKQ